MGDTQGGMGVRTGRHEDILGLEISMADAKGVAVIHCQQQLHEERPSLQGMKNQQHARRGSGRVHPLPPQQPMQGRWGKGAEVTGVFERGGESRHLAFREP